MKTLQNNRALRVALAAVLSLLLVLAFSRAAYAADLPLVNDEAGLLTETERADLQAKAEEYSATWKMDIAIYTTDGIDGLSLMNAADDYYDYNGFGQGSDYSGLVFVLDMGGRDYWFSTCGQAIYAFTDYGIQYIGDEMVSDLSAGNYYAALDTYLTQADRFLAQAAEGAPFDVSNSATPKNYGQCIGISLLIALGIAIGFFALFAMQLRTAVRQQSASSYVGGAGFALTTQRDLYLYSNTTRRAKPKDNGGSSTHSGSSGRSHGGGGGSF